MRKEVKFELYSQESCLINVRNIFGALLNLVEDRIKKNKGQWQPGLKKFTIALEIVASLIRSLDEVDRTIFTEKVPDEAMHLLRRYGPGKNLDRSKVRRQILLDAAFSERYQYVSEKIVKKICQNLKGVKNFDKILLICPHLKMCSWVHALGNYSPKLVTFSAKQMQISHTAQGRGVWICSYEKVKNQMQNLRSYAFNTVIIDEAQTIVCKQEQKKQESQAFKKYIIEVFFSFFIITHNLFDKIEFLVQLLEMVSSNDFTWMLKRYRRQNLWELKYLLTECQWYKDISVSRQEISQHFHINWIDSHQICHQKLKSVSKKFGILKIEDVYNIKNRNQRQYLEAISEALQKQKFNHISRYIFHICHSLKLKAIVIIESQGMYRSVENFLCEKQVSYCHYEHEKSMIDFNKNPNLRICLIKMSYLLTIKFGQFLIDENGNEVSVCDPYQFQCVGSARNIIFPDPEWSSPVKIREQAINQLFKFCHGEITRHYFIIRETMEVKWMVQMQQEIMEVQSNLRKDDEIQEDGAFIDTQSSSVAVFQELLLAKVSEEYQYCLHEKGICDIDDAFDAFQFEALQQRKDIQEKKKRKQARMRNGGRGSEGSVGREKKEREKEKREREKKEREDEMSSEQLGQLGIEKFMQTPQTNHYENRNNEYLEKKLSENQKSYVLMSDEEDSIEIIEIIKPPKMNNHRRQSGVLRVILKPCDF